MKILTLALLLLSTIPTYANSIEFPELTKDELENIGNEFAVNFSHTAVAAPETEGAFGIEVGAVGGKTSSPEISDVVDRTGEDGDDFQNTYSGGVMARVHFPADIFAEVTLLPETELSEVTVENKTFGLGWNAGSFFQLPLDLAIGANLSLSEISFEQVINNASTGGLSVDSKINLKAGSQVLWVGISKEFLFLTPYLKVGAAKTQAEMEVDSTGEIFAFSSSKSESIEKSGGYFAAGLNLQLLLLRLGIEASRTVDVSKVAGKISLAF